MMTSELQCRKLLWNLSIFANLTVGAESGFAYLITPFKSCTIRKFFMKCCMIVCLFVRQTSRLKKHSVLDFGRFRSAASQVSHPKDLVSSENLPILTHLKFELRVFKEIFRFSVLLSDFAMWNLARAVPPLKPGRNNQFHCW